MNFPPFAIPLARPLSPRYFFFFDGRPCWSAKDSSPPFIRPFLIDTFSVPNLGQLLSLPPRQSLIPRPRGSDRLVISRALPLHISFSFPLVFVFSAFPGLRKRSPLLPRALFLFSISTDTTNKNFFSSDNVSQMISFLLSASRQGRLPTRCQDILPCLPRRRPTLLFFVPFQWTPPFPPTWFTSPACSPFPAVSPLHFCHCSGRQLSFLSRGSH